MKLISFYENAWSDYLYWQEQDRKNLKKINDLIKESLRAPFAGTGKPEPLKGSLSDFWSRRINGEHRLVYKSTSESLIIIQCRYHYKT